MMGTPAESASRSCPVLDPSEPEVMGWNWPVLLTSWSTASWSWRSSTWRSAITKTVSNTLSPAAVWSVAMRWAVHAMESVLPEPAECWMRYL